MTLPYLWLHYPSFVKTIEMGWHNHKLIEPLDTLKQLLLMIENEEHTSASAYPF